MERQGLTAKKLILLKPQTYMNASGESVRAFKDFYGIDDENIIVIADDIDIDFGRVRVRKGLRRWAQRA